MSLKPLRGALVGAGNVSSFHLQAWQRIPDVAIVAIADPDLEKAQTRAREFNIDTSRAYASLAALLGAELDLDFVDVTAPAEVHLELVKLAAEHSVHVNCQKPFAPNLAEARAMIEACQDARVLLNINENWRWRSWYRTIKQIVSEGKLGRPIYARFFSHDSGWLHDLVRVARNHRFLRWERVILYDWGIHHVDVLRFLFGEPGSVYARIGSFSPELKGDDRAIVVLAFGDLTGLLDLSWSSYGRWGHSDLRGGNMLEDVRIEGDAGTIALIPDPVRGDLIHLTTSEEEWTRPAYDGEPIQAYLHSYVAAQSHFIQCLRSGSTPETNALDNYETLAITLAAYYSAEHNQVVNISDYKEMAKLVDGDDL